MRSLGLLGMCADFFQKYILRKKKCSRCGCVINDICKNENMFEGFNFPFIPLFCHTCKNICYEVERKNKETREEYKRDYAIELRELRNGGLCIFDKECTGFCRERAKKDGFCSKHVCCECCECLGQAVRECEDCGNILCGLCDCPRCSWGL